MVAKRQQVLITVDSTPNSDEPLILSLVLDSTPKRGQPIHGRFVASGGTGGYVFALDPHDDLPDGVTFNAITGELSGTPTAMGRTTFTATVQDSSATESDPTSFVIDVASGLTFQGALFRLIGQVGRPFLRTLGVNGATGTVTWTLNSGSLHNGLSIVGASVQGTPITPGGITYATLLASDSGSLDTLVVRFETEIREPMVDIAPDDPVEVLGGIPTTINLMEYFTGGVGPFRMVEIADSFPPGLELVRTPGNDWFMTGVPEMDAYEGDDLWSPVGVDVFDALGVQLTMAWSVLIRNPINSIGTMRGGVPSSDRTAAVLDFIGSAVKSVSVEPDFSKSTIEIEPQANAFSVLGRSGAAGGDAQNITASANDRVLARVSGALQWVQVSTAMLATAPVTAINVTAPIASTGGATPTLSHANSGVSAATYTYATLTVDARGHITSASSGTAPVTSVGLSLPAIFTVTVSPIAGGTGTLTATLATQPPAMFWSGPLSGSAAAPTFRNISITDLPATLQRILSAQAPAAGSPDTINNTVTATAFGTNYSIAAADLKAGCLIRVRAHGSYGTTGTPTLQIQLRLSNTTVLTIGAYTMPNNAPSTNSWSFEGDIFVPSIGASVACRANGSMTIGAGAAAAAATVLPQATALSIATNAIKQVQLFVTWGTANVSNTISLQQLQVEVLG